MTPLRALAVPKSPRWAAWSVSRFSIELGERRVFSCDLVTFDVRTVNVLLEHTCIFS
jgi:hypothetical protein